MYMFSLRDFRFFTYIVENRLTVLKVILSCIFSTAIGGFLVAALRRMCRRTLEIEKLAALCYILPIAVYVILNFTVVFNMCDRVVADGFSFGIAIGIILNLLRKPTGEYTARLELKGLSANISSVVWLPTDHITLKEAIATIAHDLGIEPEIRVCIESGQGSFLDRMDDKFLNQLFHQTKAGGTHIDFFGFRTFQCHIFIKEPIREPPKEEVIGVSGERSKKFTLQPNTVVRGDSTVIMSARHNNNDEYKFIISNISTFAAAAPQVKSGPQGLIQTMSQNSKPEVIRLIPWHDADDDLSETRSDISSASHRSSTKSFWGSLMGSSNSNSNSGRGSGSSPPPVVSQEPILDGSHVVLEDAVGRYMSLKAGWYLQWNKAEPRKSGAFVVEVLERAPHNILSPQGLKQAAADGFRSLQDKYYDIRGESKLSGSGLDSQSQETNSNSNSTNKDLRAGDMFRLRSLKFPQYELGITTKHLEGEYYYLGLKKSSSKSSSAGANDSGQWCHTTVFTVKHDKPFF